MKKYITILILLILLIGGGFVYFYFFRSEPHIEVSAGRSHDLKSMARICSIEFYREVPVNDTLNNKVIFAVQKQQGSISFDVEHLKIEETSDTIRIFLPPEIIEIYESTDKNSWQVIDTKAIGRFAGFRSNDFSVEEENLVKAKLKREAKKRLYQNGTVKWARKEGANTIKTLMEKLYNRPVIVIDTLQ